jgi:hypothetical protein
LKQHFKYFSDMKKNLVKSALAITCVSLLVSACGNGGKTAENPDKLPTSLINNPRSAEGMNEQDMATAPVMSFVDTMYDFGQMHEGEKAQYDFTFTNNGKRPLLITNANGSCGCTVPDFPHEPIAPGASASIHVMFNSAGKVGAQLKTVALTTNSSRGIHTLYIKAEVLETPKQ